MLLKETICKNKIYEKFEEMFKGPQRNSTFFKNFEEYC